MEITYIQTEDGRAKVEWWPKEKFAGRVTEMYTAESAEDLLRGTNLKLVNAIPIPDDSIVCDFCNERITEFPVPVVWNHALCKVCFKDIDKGG